MSWVWPNTVAWILVHGYLRHSMPNLFLFTGRNVSESARRQDSALWPSVRLRRTSYRLNRTLMLSFVPKLLWSTVWKRSLPAQGRRDYALRTTIEERHRQLKCFSDLEAFTSRSFNVIVNQVVFVLLTYSLLQWYLLRIGRQELNTKTRTRTLDLLRPTTTVILIFYQNYVAYLSPLEHQELVLTLDEDARKKILAKTRRLRRSLANHLMNPRPP